MAKLIMQNRVKIIILIAAIGFAGFIVGVKNQSSNVVSTTEETIFGRGFQSQEPSGGDKANPAYQITFPHDHRSHSNFDIEWWYLTANLVDEDGNDYGLQWTLFRFKNPAISYENRESNSEENNWHNDQLYMAHASIHSMEEHWFEEKLAYGGVGNAGQIDTPFSLFIDDWNWENSAEESLLAEMLLPANLSFSLLSRDDPSNGIKEVEAKLKLQKTGPYVFHGQNGYSIKSGNAQHASHYYSAPFIDISGRFTFKTTIDGKAEITTKTLTGSAWYDQEWTSQLLDTTTLGWDWLSLHLDDGSKIMAFRMRLDDHDDYITGSYINAEGELSTLSSNDISLVPTSEESLKIAGSSIKQLPLEWELKIPSKEISLTIKTRKKDQWNPALISYYEGMVSVEGSHSGKGFLELTGY